MNDFIPGTHEKGKIIFDNHNIYNKNIDEVALRTRIGMVFQKPNVFKSIYDNVAYGMVFTLVAIVLLLRLQTR